MSLFGIVIIALFFATYGCGETDHTSLPAIDSPPPISASLRTRIKNAQQFRDLFTLKRIVHLETTKESLMGTIECVKYLATKKEFLIVDDTTAKRAFLFDSSGTFLSVVGKNGKGPGEYGEPQAVAYDDGQIIIYGWPPAKLLYYSLTGDYSREVSFTRRNWLFLPDKMVLLDDDLYIYTNNQYARKGHGGKEFRVFRLRNGTEFDQAFGAPEETLDFGEGAITSAWNKIYYTGVFDGNIYEIDPSTDSHSVFCSLGPLTDAIDKAKQSENPIQYMLYTAGPVDQLSDIAVIKNVMFVERLQMVTLLDAAGEILRRDLPQNLETFLLEEDDDFAARLVFSFYQSGIIVAANLASRISEADVPNPSLLLYELIDN